MAKKTLLALFLMSAATPATAWNDRGHMTVAAVAWDKITPRTRQEASRLLRLNPHHGRWIAQILPAKRDQAAFIRAATWPDKIRGEYEDDGYDPVEPRASQNIGYADRFVHRYWHYQDNAFSPDGTALEPLPAVNAVSRIVVFSTTLRDASASDDVKSFDLAWLLHLVGDIHQPLHAAERYTVNFRHGDSGGNGVKVCVTRASSCGLDNGLHSFWDGALGNSDSVRSAILKAGDLQSAIPDDDLVAEPQTWADESFALAKQHSYRSPIRLNKGPYRLTPAYERDAGSLAEKRVTLAGYRLARLLNAAFDPPGG